MSKRIAGLEVRAKTYFVADDEVQNLLVKVYATGRKSYVFRHRVPGTDNKKERVIGDCTKITVQQARKKAREIQAEVILGVEEPPKPVVEEAPMTLKEVGDRWLRSLEELKRSPAYIDNVRRILKLHIYPEVGGEYVTDVQRSAIIKIMDRMISAGKPDLSHKVRGIVSMILNFAVEREWVEHNVAAPIRNKTKAVKRDRVLTKEQLRKVKDALSGGQLGEDTTDVIRVLMHTGQRRGEVLGMTWDELDFEASMWRLPGSRTKNGQPHNVPLSNQVSALLKKRMPEEPKPETLVFDVAVYTIGQACRRIAVRHKFPAFSSHDFRRTLASTLPEVDPAVNEDQIRRIINHISGRGALAHYAHYRFDDEKRQTLQKWSDWLDRL